MGSDTESVDEFFVKTHSSREALPRVWDQLVSKTNKIEKKTGETLMILHARQSLARTILISFKEKSTRKISLPSYEKRNPTIQYIKLDF